MDEIRIGDRVKDSITSFTGIVTARTEWLNGCVRYLIQSEKLKDGKPIEPEWFDREQVILVKAVASKKSKTKPGGPKTGEVGTRRTDPKRRL